MLRRRKQTRGPEPIAEALLKCRACHSGFMCPLDWRPEDDERWWLLLRCGECGVWLEDVIGNDAAAVLDRCVDRQADSIARELWRLESERMRAEADTLATALAGDLIGADDFAR